MTDEKDITGWLNELQKGSDSAFDDLFPLVYDHLRSIAYLSLKDQPAGHTLSKTDLVHEVYLKMVNQKEANWEDRAHFYSVASKAMRHILIDHARKKQALKRKGSQKEITYIDEIMNAQYPEEEQLLYIDKALNQLAEFDERMATIVEFRYFGEMKIKDIAEVLNLSPRTIKRDWAIAKGWLYKALKKNYNL